MPKFCHQNPTLPCFHCKFVNFGKKKKKRKTYKGENHHKKDEEGIYIFLKENGRFNLKYSHTLIIDITSIPGGGGSISNFVFKKY